MDSEVFNCTQCGRCCHGYGGTYVSEADIAAIADYIGTDRATFVRRYCTLSGTRYLLAQQDNGYCIFFDRNCTIHPVKPQMCRNWPFLESVLRDAGNWHAMASTCEGMRTDLSDPEIQAAVRMEIQKRRRGAGQE